MVEKLLPRTWMRLLVILLVGGLAYSGILNSPFVFDDQSNIINNGALRDFRNFWPPTMTRWVASLTFAINLRLGGLDTFGFHVVNVAIHLVVAVLVYALALLTLQTPFLSSPPPKGSEDDGGDDGSIAFFTALIFVVHPVQTQSVTYVVQRYTSLATLLYLLALVLYLTWRSGLEPGSARRGATSGGGVFWWGPSAANHPDAGSGAQQRAVRRRLARAGFLYAGCVASTVLAMKTKEIAFTLPVVVLLYESLLFEGVGSRRFFALAPLLAAMLIIPGDRYVLAMSSGGRFSLDQATRFLTEMPRAHYVLTQLPVLVTYLRLLFFPVGLNLDHDFPVFDSFATPAVAGSFVVLVVVGGLGLTCARFAARAAKNRGAAGATGRRRSFGLVAFGIFWFFITVSVESSFIALTEVISENRLYLPSVGVILAFVGGLHGLAGVLGRKCSRRQAAARLLPLLLAGTAAALLTATLMRNYVWRDTSALCEDMVRKSPRSPRAHNNRGLAYLSANLTDKAIEEFLTSLRLDPGNAIPHYNLALAYRKQGLLVQAAEHARLYRQAEMAAKPGRQDSP